MEHRRQKNIDFIPKLKKLKKRKLRNQRISKDQLFWLLEITDDVTRRPAKEGDFKTVVTRNDNGSKDSLLLSAHVETKSPS